MRPLALLLAAATATGCYCSHGRDRDAGAVGDATVPTDARSPVDAAPPDAGPPPTCGPPELAPGPLCAPSTCGAEALSLRAFTSIFELFPHVGLTGDDTVWVPHRGEESLLSVSVVTGGAADLRQAPVAAFGSGLLARAAGQLFLLGREVGTNDPKVLRVYADAFTLVPTELGDGTVGGGFTGDSSGCLHVLLNGGRGRWVVDGARSWSAPVPGRGTAIELAADGTPHVLAVRALEDGGSELVWTAAAAEETVDTIEGPSPGWRARLAVVGDVPHALYLGEAGSLRHARRGASWEVTVLAEPSTTPGCGVEPPTGPGDTCERDRVTPRPLAALTDATGELRLVYAVVTEHAVLTASCGGEDLPPELCPGWSEERTHEGELHVVDPVTGADAVVSDLAAWDGHGVADGDAIQLALEVREGAGQSLQHLVVR